MYNIYIFIYMHIQIGDCIYIYIYTWKITVACRLDMSPMSQGFAVTCSATKAFLSDPSFSLMFVQAAAKLQQ